MSSRHSARQQAFQILFQADQRRCAIAEARVLFENHLAAETSSDHPTPRPIQPLCQALIEAYARAEHEVNATILSASDNWRLDRMPAVDRAILRVGTTELVYLSETPSRIVIHEAVILAKQFGSESSPGFVNGVLDHIAKSLQRESL